MISLIALPALFISVYLGLYQLRLVDTIWDPFFGEQSRLVLDSKVSQKMEHWFGLPDALMGAFAYLGDIIFALVGSTRRWQYRPWMVMLFGLDVIPLGIVSSILVFMQGTVVGAWCFLCLVTAVISLILVILAYDEVWSCLIYLYRVRQRAHQRPDLKWILWKTFWGVPSQLAHEIGEEMLYRDPTNDKHRGHNVA